jgi:serine/threonine protein kinase
MEPELTLPKRIGNYEILDRLAVGGMAEVLLGRAAGEGEFEKLVAIKRVLPHLAEEQAFIEMFLDEARIAAKLNHSNIVVSFEGDARSDIFAAGVVLFELLTNQNPYHEEGETAYRGRAQMALLPAPSRLVGDLPEELEAICMKAVDVNPGQRFPAAAPMGAALERYGHRNPFTRSQLAAWMKASFRETYARHMRIAGMPPPEESVVDCALSPPAMRATSSPCCWRAGLGPMAVSTPTSTALPMRLPISVSMSRPIEPRTRAGAPPASPSAAGSASTSPPTPRTAASARNRSFWKLGLDLAPAGVQGAVGFQRKGTPSRSLALPRLCGRVQV